MARLLLARRHQAPRTAAWRGPSNRAPREELTVLLQPAPDDRLEAYAVSRRVNDPRADDPLVLEPAGGDRLEEEGERRGK